MINTIVAWIIAIAYVFVNILDEGRLETNDILAVGFMAVTLSLFGIAAEIRNLQTK
jgi:hypothetical protein